MPVTNWWTVDDLAMLITGGPYLWDGTTSWTPPPGNRAVSADPTAQGYSWPNAPADSPSMTALTNRVAALEARLAQEARGRRWWPAVGLLLLGASDTQIVALKTPMPSASYTPSVLLTGGPLAGSFTVTAAPAGASAVSVTIKAVVAATITANSLNVLVFADA